MKGYKAFDEDLRCRGYQYEVGGEFAYDGDIAICERGFHFCDTVAQVFSFYPAGSRVCEVEAVGNVVGSEDGKHCTDRLRIVRELDAAEISREANTGNADTGVCNSGNRNSGNRNSGSWNSGDWNSGDCNSGDRNSGDRNSGNRNSGNRNSGNWNSGNWNSGNWNSGDWNSGNWNSGNRNSGDCNSGNWNSGNRNSGNCNSGNLNSGDWNSGDWNATDYSSGVLCTEEPECLVFDRPSGMTLRDWRMSYAAEIMGRIRIPSPYWKSWVDLSESERELNARLECQGGMLVVPEDCGKPDFAGWWAGLDDGEKRIILAIPNFDADKWERITGLHVHGEMEALR